VKEYAHDVDAFDKYYYGTGVMQDASQREDLIDQIRHFVEECDSPQGFHVFSDIDNGFGGVGSVVIDEMHDVFGNLPVSTFGVSPYENNTMTQEQRHINTVLSHTSLAQASTMYIPIITGNWPVNRLNTTLTYDVKNSYHTSAIIAAAIDGVTSCYRTFARNGDMHTTALLHCPTLNMNICAIRTSFPTDVAPALLKNLGTDATEASLTPTDLTYSLLPTPDRSIPYALLRETTTMRGTGAANLPLLRERVVKALSLQYTRHDICFVKQPLVIHENFPFNVRDAAPILSVISRLQTTKNVYHYFSEMAKQFKAINPLLHPDYVSNDVDFREIYEEANRRAEAYAPMDDE
jgi:hypothetical protein